MRYVALLPRLVRELYCPTTYIVYIRIVRLFFFFLTKMPQPLLWVGMQATCMNIIISGKPNLQNYYATFTVHKLFIHVTTGTDRPQVAHPWSKIIQKYIKHCGKPNFRVTSAPLVATLLHNCKFTPNEFQPTRKSPMQYDAMLFCKRYNKLYTFKL